MLAVQLMNPTAAAAAELVRNALGSAQNDGRYATVPKPSSVNMVMSIRFECGRKNHAINATAAMSWGSAKCQRRSPVRSELEPSSNIPISPAPKIGTANQVTFKTLQLVNRWSMVGSQNQNAYPPV